MTQPIFQPTTQRVEARLGFGNDQLFRRPAPTGSIPSAAFIVDNMSLSTTFTDVDFTSIVNDDSNGTLWDLTGGNCRVLVSGFYSVTYVFSGFSLSAGADSVLFAQVNISSGSTGVWSAKQLSGSAQELYHQSALLMDALGPPAPTIWIQNPQMWSYVTWNPTDTFPAVLQLQAYVEVDGSGVAKTPDIRMFICRLGNSP